MKKLFPILFLACLMFCCTEKSGNGNGNGNGEIPILPEVRNPEIYDVENLFSNPLVVVDDIDSAVIIPMDLVSTSPPVKSVPSIPKHTSMEFGVYIQQEGAVKSSSTNNE
ncbi:hypothetical protein DWB61_03150 [Ancylomarina euxinus]|uniref:Uncharacterized protein n=1 Tax=Ancylomarina euxinus TaxID=2283627 RepID=A0A425Y701_9BACT|nr:hypothetical protein [Ancylomarina euxinus]MCZ4693999.1 hypothetical protein [Ancylomarina euxinus]MUP14581.1 hypothetical protein [Ancylomarina euxinus]RRG24130.1 hypothetical protein DWB61_03150 [Ancylomarina euxinus]